MVTRPINAKVDQVTNAADKCLASETPKSFEQLSIVLEELEDLARETFQALVHSDGRRLAQKLRSGQSLNSSERELLELFIIGEATYYVRHEKDYPNWIEELKRLTSEMRRLKSQGLHSVDEVMSIHALCQDAENLLPDVMLYLREKERIERFRSNVQSGTIPPQIAGVLADLIDSMLASDQV